MYPCASHVGAVTTSEYVCPVAATYESTYESPHVHVWVVYPLSVHVGAVTTLV